MRLTLPTGTEYFKVDDAAFGLINALILELQCFRSAQDKKRAQIASTYIGKDGILYGGADGANNAVLFVDNTAMRLKSITQLKADELEQLRKELRKR